jgi:hypothetical protein
MSPEAKWLLRWMIPVFVIGAVFGASTVLFVLAMVKANHNRPASGRVR